MESWRSKLFWPILLIALACAIGLAMQLLKREDPLPTVTQTRRTRPFDLVITKVVRTSHNIELLEVEFEHWQLHDVSVDILKPGLIRTFIMRNVPDAVIKKTLNTRLNKSTAQIVTNCTASVELEVPMETDTWTIRIEGDTAEVLAPVPAPDQVLVNAETLRGWVIQEDLLVDGEKEKELLLKRVQRRLSEKVKSREFLRKHRETCRVSLADFLQKQFQVLDETRDVKHIYVRFADEDADVE